jgi:flavin reductase (DIM6/NTAB) family NADH-FMN oxidoreductase RutF
LAKKSPLVNKRFKLLQKSEFHSLIDQVINLTFDQTPTQPIPYMSRPLATPPFAIADAQVFDSKDLRKAYSKFGTGVTVMTAISSDGVLAGVTASSFNTVSIDPPIVLWSLALTSPSLRVFRDAGHFIVNVLGLHQRDLSQRFSRPNADKFAGLAMGQAVCGAPVLIDCAATLECATLSEQIVGDHVLFLGQVQRYEYASVEPLLFFNGKYVQPIDIGSTQ